METGEIRTLESGRRLLALEDVGSTNAVCLEKAAADDPGGLWVTAKRQLQGKGSRGRNWVSEKGNFYGSLLLREAGSLEKLHTLTYAASLAIRDVIHSLNGGQFARVTLKWPNDVLLNERKTSGILLESHQVGGARFVIVGMGVNIAHHPADTLHSATDLNREGIQADPERFLTLLDYAMAKRLNQWSRGDGFTDTRQDWIAAAHGIGSRVEIRLPGQSEPASGTFKGIDNEGLLVIAGAGRGEQRISVADIFFA